MNETAKISLYKIKSCGFYKRGEKKFAQFGGLNAMLEELQVWGATKNLGITKTYEATENSSLPAYLVDVRKIGSNWLLTLWNEIESTDGAVASMDGAAKVGRADATLTELDEGAIPGFATYFWFLVEKNLVATVRVEQRSAGHYQMNRYLQGFLERFSSHVVISENQVENDEVTIDGYKANPQGKITHYRPRFRSEMLTKAGAIDFLRDRVDRINRITRHGALTLMDKVDRQLWEKMLISFHLITPRARPIDVKMNFDLEVSNLDQASFDTIVDEANDDDLNRYGFRLTGESEIHWLDRQYVKDDLIVDITRKPGGVIEPDSLLSGLIRHRGNIVALIEA